MAGRPYEPVPPRAPRFGLVPDLLARCEPETAAALQAAADRFARAGAAVLDVRLPASFEGLADAGLAVLEAEAAAAHEAWFAAHGPEYGKEIRALVEAGLAQPAVCYVRANRARLRFREDVVPLLGELDALLVPTVPAPAPPGLAWTGDASLCAPWSYAGVPALSLPCGLARSGLPLALQLVAAPDAEARLFDVGQWCEDVLAFAAAPPR